MQSGSSWLEVTVLRRPSPLQVCNRSGARFTYCGNGASHAHAHAYDLGFFAHYVLTAILYDHSMSCRSIKNIFLAPTSHSRYSTPTALFSCSFFSDHDAAVYNVQTMPCLQWTQSKGCYKCLLNSSIVPSNYYRCKRSVYFRTLTPS